MKDIFEALVGRVDTLIGLVRAGLLEGKTQRGQIKVLSKAGFKPKEIAEIVKTTPNTVRVELAGLRKEKKKSRISKEEGKER